ncbi:tRNA (adenosine(37)-N6)-threonylcarbamoyltransferase complex ATPase subunit type 1 TsaE [Patescibacteria group bacterium]|nr:tRNA (adenosine(37)-N6)-threonylcarbamoyltransferase complex ATPase subunit type 1 TsaE [Patescibacteria group bacterium]
MEKKIITGSDQKTRSLAKSMAENCLKTGLGFVFNGQAMIFALDGSLGSGKTTFIQGFAKGLGIREKILSPTFVILKRFKITKPKGPNPTRSQRFAPRCGPESKALSPKFKNFYHIDCYRIKDSQEILDLGFEEIISDPENIVVIEWADKIKEVLPKNIAVINFKLKDKNIREIIIKSEYNFG